MVSVRVVIWHLLQLQEILKPLLISLAGCLLVAPEEDLSPLLLLPQQLVLEKKVKLLGPESLQMLVCRMQEPQMPERQMLASEWCCQS
jgi:hypothetical protein